MPTDILSRQDIKTLVDAFYQKVKVDNYIGPYFTEVAQIDWEHHLPQMYDFWESILFARSVFNGNPLKKHIELHKKQVLTEAHFEHWLSLFTKVVDAHFIGINTDKIKAYAGIIKDNLVARVVKQQQVFEPSAK